MSLIKGLHHVAMKCCNTEEYKKVVSFYRDVLGLVVARTWDTGIMFETGNGIVEVFTDAESQLPQGVIRHFAFATDDVDACVKAVTEAGYDVFFQPLDIVISEDNPMPARIAFCHGPLGEEIEFFDEK